MVFKPRIIGFEELRHLFVKAPFYLIMKEGIRMEIAEIRNRLEEMNEKINSFRGSL
jgi:hypothetical protein